MMFRKKRRLAERRFVKMTFGWTTIRKMTFGWTTIRENVVRHYEVSLIRRFGHVTIWSNDFRQNNLSAKLHFGETTIRWNDVSGKWCGPIMGSSHFRRPKNELVLAIFHTTSIIDIHMILFGLDKSTLKLYEKNFYSFYVIFIFKISASS